MTRRYGTSRRPTSTARSPGVMVSAAWRVAFIRPTSRVPFPAGCDPHRSRERVAPRPVTGAPDQSPAASFSIAWNSAAMAAGSASGLATIRLRSSFRTS